MNRPPLQLYGAGQPRQPGAAAAPASDQDNATRQQFYRCESGIRMVSYLYIVGGLCALVPGMLFISTMMDGRLNVGVIAVSIPLIVGGAFGIAHGIALYRFKPWARALGAILCGLGLVGSAVRFVIALLVLLSAVTSPRGNKELTNESLIIICFAIGSFVISVRIFNLLQSQDARSVCTEWYASVVARTDRPQRSELAKHKSSGATWIFLLAVAILVGALAFFIRYPVE